MVAHYVRDVGVGRSSRLIPTDDGYKSSCEIRGISAWVFLFCFLYPSVPWPNASLIPTVFERGMLKKCSSFAFIPLGLWPNAALIPTDDGYKSSCEIRGISVWVFLFCVYTPRSLSQMPPLLKSSGRALCRPTSTCSKHNANYFSLWWPCLVSANTRLGRCSDVQAPTNIQ